MKADKDSGAAAVEFALVLIPLLLVVFGMIDFGRLLYTQVSLDHIAREGVRIAALGRDPTEGTDGDVWKAKLLDPADMGSGVPTVSTVTVCSGGANYADVAVTSNFTFLIADTIFNLIPGATLDHEKTLTGKAEAKCLS